jgi:hypothetical protein
MIRRLFWVTVGALVGVTGYRRVSRLARAAGLGGRGSTGRRSRAGLDWGGGGGAALFARDVREGMELYADRHPRLAGRTLEGQRARTRQRPQGAAPGEQRRRPAYPGIDYVKDGR